MFGKVRAKRFELRRWRGKLYSRFCAVGDLETHCTTPPSDTHNMFETGIGYDTISMSGHPTSPARLYKFMEDFLWRCVYQHGWMRRGDCRDERIWVGGCVHDAPPFREWQGDLKSCDMTELEELDRHYRAICERLLVIGDHVWIEVKKPCIAVMHYAEVESTDYLRRPKAYVFHALLPDLETNDSMRRWFPIDQGEQALEHARRYCESGDEVVDLRLPIECDTSEFGFDSDGERLWNVAYTLALHCKESARMIPRKFSDDEHELIADAYAEAIKTNSVLGERGSPEFHIRKLMELSERTKYRGSRMTLGLPWEDWKRSRLHGEILDLLDNREIDIYRLG
ncbi:hypothetical protein [Rhizobium sp. BK176]|uniref:hypothetical protein n=1 Tax=Rhizobium sp. BK176 TaxID=2587071 RepID=UPI00216A5801|nr:hypothetical protein [Rhizobium sp. BK176]